MKIYVIHENQDWTTHLFARLEELNLPYEDWNLSAGLVDLSDEPPQGVFYNRMSASSHTRGNRFAPELTGVVLKWLEAHGRVVVNGSRALAHELSKVNQYLALEKYGIQTPKTVAVVGKDNIVAAAKKLNVTLFITKHNRAGKGLGVMKFNTLAELEKHVASDAFEAPVDGITLLQAYIYSEAGFITRSEFIGGKYLYSVKVDTSEGFELCPADACQIGEAFCPAPSAAPSAMKFEVINNDNEAQIKAYEAFLKGEGIDVAGIEFIEDAKGVRYTYDVNTNTNYNREAEEKAGVYAMLELASYLGKRLEQIDIK